MSIIEPVTLEDAKKQCRVEYDTDDELISGYITAARQWAEGFLNFPLAYDDEDEEAEPIVVKQTWKQAILLVVAYWFANRENASSITLSEIPLGAKDLLWIDRNVPV